MKLLKYTFVFLVFGMMYSCELVESPNDTENVSEGFITFPALTLEGSSFILLDVGGDYSDPGYKASLGTDDITDQVVVSGDVDPNTPGLYPVNYSVETTNELGNDQTVVVTRSILVQDPAVEAVDLSGSYQGSGFGSDIATVVKTGLGQYTCDKLLASGNNIAVTFYHAGGNTLAIVDQQGPFGNMNTTTPGTSASLTSDGFEWTVFIGCCGNFGPINFVKL